MRYIRGYRIITLGKNRFESTSFIHKEQYNGILVALKLMFTLSLEKRDDSLLKWTAQNGQPKKGQKTRLSTNDLIIRFSMKTTLIIRTMETAYNIISESVSLISRRKASTKKQWIPDLNSKVI